MIVTQIPIEVLDNAARLVDIGDTPSTAFTEKLLAGKEFKDLAARTVLGMKHEMSFDNLYSVILSCMVIGVEMGLLIGTTANVAFIEDEE